MPESRHAEMHDALAVRRAVAILRKRMQSGRGRLTNHASPQALKTLIAAARLVAEMDARQRPEPARAARLPDDPGAGDETQLDDLERQLLAKSRSLEFLSQRHESAVRRFEQQGARQVAEIERLRAQVDLLKASPDRGRSAGQGTETFHGRFARHRSHPLVDDALDIAHANPYSPEYSMNAPLFTRTNFQPTFKPNPDAVYDITDFLALHDRAFVRAAYLAILRREPDPEGAENYVGLVRAGEPKARLLRDFLLSEEGRSHRTEIRGLDAHLRVLRLCELPLVGRWIAAVLFLANVNGHLRDLRVLENHVIRIAEESQAVHEANLSKLRSISK